MPTYVHHCTRCGMNREIVRAIADRNLPLPCVMCGAPDTTRLIGAPLFKFAGRVTPGGGPDRFTADMLGIPLKELPDGLKSE